MTQFINFLPGQQLPLSASDHTIQIERQFSSQIIPQNPVFELHLPPRSPWTTLVSMRPITVCTPLHPMMTSQRLPTCAFSGLNTDTHENGYENNHGKGATFYYCMPPNFMWTLPNKFSFADQPKEQSLTPVPSEQTVTTEDCTPRNQRRKTSKISETFVKRQHISHSREDSDDDNALGNMYSAEKKDNTGLPKIWLSSQSSGQFNNKIEKPYGGERRLVISFSNFGTLGKHPQKLGKKCAFVPDGLAGRFKMYRESFRFCIQHGNELVECEDGKKRVLITWTVINEPSGQMTQVVETPLDAMRRNVSGKTICNKVFHEVLKKRAISFESDIQLENEKERKDNVKLACMVSMAASFRPKTFSLGPLAFGLLHSTVQERMLQELLELQDIQVSTT